MFKTLQTCVEAAQNKGIIIVRRHQFRWYYGEVLECDAIGAWLIENELAQPGFPKGWLEDFCHKSGKDTYWFWRFTQGWTYGNSLTITRKDPKTKEWITKSDKVSRVANDLAKKYCGE